MSRKPLREDVDYTADILIVQNIRQTRILVNVGEYKGADERKYGRDNILGSRLPYHKMI